jgi:GDP-L-fucose synthase
MRSVANDLIIGADGFLGRNLENDLTAQGRVVARIGRADSDLSDWLAVERLFAAAPTVQRIFHVVTRQRTGSVQYGIQGELLAINARVHLKLLEAWR